MAGGSGHSRRATLLVTLLIFAALIALALYLVQAEGPRRQLLAFLDRARAVARQKATLPHRMLPPADSLAQLGSGWVYLGTYDAGKRAFRHGPYTEVAYCVVDGRTGPLVPHRGDILRVRAERQVIIGDYRLEGMTHVDQAPPFVHELLSGLDTTGVRLPAGFLVVVRDVQAPRRLDAPRSIWCRVAECDPDSVPGAAVLEKLRAGATPP